MAYRWAVFGIAAISLFLASGLPANANPLAELIALSIKVGSRAGVARSIPFELRAARIASDRSFRNVMFKELEQTGSRATAEKLAAAWARADTPIYREAII